MATRIAKPAVTALADIKAKLSAEVENIQDQISKPSGNRIRTKGKVFTFPDGGVDEGPISLVVVDFVTRNKYYIGKYDENNPTPPECFAVGKTIKDLKPSPNSPDIQAKSCAECPLNQFGSDGKGKACKNTRMLAVLPPDEVSPTAELMTLEVSPTALKNFDAMANTVKKLYGMPLIGAVIDVEFNPTVDYPSLLFKNPEENRNVEAHYNRREDAEVLLFSEPDFAPPTAPVAPTRARRARA